MNPIVKYRYSLVRYLVLYGLFSAGYAAAFGLAASLPAGAAVLGGVVFWAVTGFEGLILWNVLKYGTEGIRTSLLKALFYIIVGMLFVGVALGAECVAMVAAKVPMGAFAQTIPARGLLTALAYVCFALWYWFALRSDEEAAERAEAESIIRGSTNTLEAAARPEPLERITVRSQGGKIEVIATEEIIYIQAEGDYVAIVTSSGRWLKEGTMKWFEEALPRGGFIRVHRSYIVSVAQISSIETSGREHSLILRGGGALRISEGGYKLLKQTLGL